MSEAIAAILAKRAKLAAQLDNLVRQTIPIRADIRHLDAALAILGGPTDRRRLRAQHRPGWVADFGRLVLDVVRGASEPMTSRAIAVEIMRLAGDDAGDGVALGIVTQRVHAALSRRIGVVERVALGARRKGWRVVEFVL